MESTEKKTEEKDPMRIAERRFKGILMWQCEAEEFETMETRADDIWICTYPRSGTTMTIELVYLIQTLDFETANNVQLKARVPFLDCKDDRYPYYKGKKTIDDMKSPSMIKSHLHHFLLPEQLRKGKGRIIYMYRNPKDVVISLFKLFAWTNQLEKGENMFGWFFDSFVDGTAYACPWSEHVLGYWENKDEPQVLFLRYENVVKDMCAAIRRIAAFLRRELTDNDVAKIAEHCSIENMGDNDKVNLSYWQDIGYVEFKPNESHFINQGTTMTIELVYLIQTLDFETANNVQLEARVPFLDCKDDRYPYYKGKKTIDDMKSPRMIKSHLHHFLLPEQLRKGKGRIIYMYRNPKDVVISLFKLFAWTNQLEEGENMFGRFFDSFVDGTAYACPWSKHVLGYWENKDEPQVLFLRYEDVVKDMCAAIRRIATFLRRELTDNDVAKIAEHCSIENMRDNDKVNLSYWQDIGYVEFKPNESHFINQGHPGTWHENLTPEQVAKMDKLIQEVEDAGVNVVHT